MPLIRELLPPDVAAELQARFEARGTQVEASSPRQVRMASTPRLPDEIAAGTPVVSERTGCLPKPRQGAWQEGAGVHGMVPTLHLSRVVLVPELPAASLSLRSLRDKVHAALERECALRSTTGPTRSH